MTTAAGNPRRIEGAEAEVPRKTTSNIGAIVTQKLGKFKHPV
jgi:hypothetical protein